MIAKNRNRGKQDFANINLLGKCNADCYFCLGKDIKQELKGINQCNIHFSKWKNFLEFICLCKGKDIKKLYLTGQTVDGLQYKYIDELVDYLQLEGFNVGVRTNGILINQTISTIQKMKGGIGVSIHSINNTTNNQIMGVKVLDWKNILPKLKNLRVSIVYNRYNANEFYDLLKFLAEFKNIRYIQVRRISTDTRLKLLMDDILLYEKMLESVRGKELFIDKFYSAERYEIFGKEVCFWTTVETDANSINYFTDGTISDEYFIVEGYLKNKTNKD